MLEPPRGRGWPRIESRRQRPVQNRKTGCEARDGAARPDQRAGGRDACHRLHAGEIDQSGERRAAAADHGTAQRVAERAPELDIKECRRARGRRAIGCFCRQQQRRGDAAANPCAMQAAGQPH